MFYEFYGIWDYFHALRLFLYSISSTKTLDTVEFLVDTWCFGEKINKYLLWYMLRSEYNELGSSTWIDEF